MRFVAEIYASVLSSSPAFNASVTFTLPFGLEVVGANTTTNPSLDVTPSVQQDQSQLLRFPLEYSDLVSYGRFTVTVDTVISDELNIGDRLQAEASLEYFSSSYPCHSTSPRDYNASLDFSPVFVGYIVVQALILDGESNVINTAVPGELFTLTAVVNLLSYGSRSGNLTVFFSVAYSGSPTVKTEDLVSLHQTSLNDSTLVQ